MNEKEMSFLENQLRSWHPRRPSPKVKRRLFGVSEPTEAAILSLRWLIPAAACLLLALTIASQEPGFSAVSSHREPMMGLISSNLSYVNVLSTQRPAGLNRISTANFEWTNLSGFTSSISPFSPGRMN